MNDVAKLESAGEAPVHRTGATVPELFLINLCASMTPMPSVPRNLKGFEKYKLYQVSRQEDGRRRFRLRLGFFTSEADAEWVLNSVRNLYPTAFTGCVTQEDMRYFGESAPAASAVVPKPAPTPGQSTNRNPGPSTTSVAKQPAVAATPAASKLTATQTSAAKPAVPATTAPKHNLSLETPTASAVKPSQSVAAQPFHVARGVQVPETNLELTDEYAILSPPVTTTAAGPGAFPAPTKPVTNGKQGAPAVNGPVHSATLINPPKVVDDYVPILDTTLTIRTLTRAEAEDPNRPKWFAVQLALSEQPINLDTMPKLDIFAAYTLYSVAMMEGGTIKHALRLGFFRENVSAEAVMGYLKAFFNTPSLTQIATAEYERFAEPKPKIQPNPATEAKVVNLDGKRPVAPAKTAGPVNAPKSASSNGNHPTTTAKPKAAKPRVAPPPRPQSFLSRLIGRQLD
jgi:hypothetical protein